MAQERAATLFTEALGLQAPWSVSEVRFDAKTGRIDLFLAMERGARFPCPICAAPDQPLHDTLARTWRHLSFFQYEAYLHAKVPRVHCGSCGKTTQVEVPWARARSGFTLLMEALLLTLCEDMPVHKVAQMAGVSDKPVWHIVDVYVDSARAKEDFSAVSSLAVDETASRRGHNYISIFHDLVRRRVMFSCEGRDAAVFEKFVEDLKAHQGDPAQITDVAMDMSVSYIAGATKSLPQAEITFDPFHVVKQANEAVDKVRREEARTQPLLKKTRYLWLKSSSKLSERQKEELAALSIRKLKTARAWRIKENLRDIYASKPDFEDAEELFEKWYSWAIRSRIEPIKEVARMIKAHWKGVLNTFRTGTSTGFAEGMNSLIQAVKARARGFGTTRHMIAMLYLIGGELAHLPASPLTTRSCGLRPVLRSTIT